MLTVVNETTALASTHNGYEDKGAPRKQQRLLYFDEIPQWQRDNEYLLSGYRQISGSLLLSLKSALQWHNETINIHSHIVGVAIFALFPLHFYFTLYSKVHAAELVDFFTFMVYFVGVAVCFACSASFHMNGNHSHRVAALQKQRDLCGIVLLMWSASIPSIYLGFICQPPLRWLHWALISSSACGCIIFTLNPRFVKPAFRTYRAILYVSLGLSAVIYVAHGVHLYGFAIQRKRFAIEWMVLMALLNLSGAAVYASRFPERWFPYRFDRIGASHQIFHILVLAAGLVHYKGLTCAFLSVRQDGGVCPS